MTVDVVVLGGGAAGMAATITAAESGCHKVVVLEQRVAVGGNSRSGGGSGAAGGPVALEDESSHSASLDRQIGRDLSTTGSAIPGLYAAGVVTGGWQGDTYCSRLLGSASGFSLTAGRIAGANAATYARAS